MTQLQVTAKDLTAAAKAITDAIADLTKGDQLLPAPETDPDYANFVEIPLDQQDVESGDVHLAPKEDRVLIPSSQPRMVSALYSR